MLKHGFSVLNIAEEQEDSMPDKLTIQNSAWFTDVSEATFPRVPNHNPSVHFLPCERVRPSGCASIEWCSPIFRD